MRSGKTEEMKMKPCPFCGGKAILLKQNGGEQILARCSMCQGRMLCYTRLQKQAVAQWNRRTTSE